VHLTLRNLTLTGGRIVVTNSSAHTDGEAAFGAAIYNNGGVVNLDGCTISEHLVAGGSAPAATKAGGKGGSGGPGVGAAIYNFAGQLIVTNTVFSDNVAGGG